MFSRPPYSFGIHSPFFAAVVEVQHRSHRVDAQSVDVVLVQPEQRVGDQEIADFVAAVIEDHRAPVGMLALPRILVFVQRRAVEASQAVAVPREMGRHPIENHADAVAMAVVDEVHEVFGRAVAAGDRIVAHRLIAPTARERMLADRQQFEVRVAHLLAVVHQSTGQLPIVQPAVQLVARSAANCPDALRRSRSAGSARRACGAVPSRPGRSSGNATGRPRSMRCAAATRRRTRTDRSCRSTSPSARPHAELVLLTRAHLGNEQFPDAAGNVLAHRMPPRVPAIEFPDHADGRRVGSPDGEVRARSRRRPSASVRPACRRCARAGPGQTGRNRNRSASELNE